MSAQGRSHAGCLSDGHHGHHCAVRFKRLLLARDAAPGHQQLLHAKWNEATIGDAVPLVLQIAPIPVIVNDRAWAIGDGIRKGRVVQGVLRGERILTLDESRLSDAEQGRCFHDMRAIKCGILGLLCSEIARDGQARGLFGSAQLESIGRVDGWHTGSP